MAFLGQVFSSLKLNVTHHSTPCLQRSISSTNTEALSQRRQRVCRVGFGMTALTICDSVPRTPSTQKCLGVAAVACLSNLRGPHWFCAVCRLRLHTFSLRLSNLLWQGPELCSQHSHRELTTSLNSSSRGSICRLWPLWALALTSTYARTDTRNTRN